VRSDRPAEQITLAAAQRAIATIVARSEEKGYCIAVAVVDEHGDLIAFARMDDSTPRWVRNAQKKAYTSAIMGRDTMAFFRELQARGRNLSDYGDPNFTTLPGGVVAYAGKRIAGAVGVTGRAAGEDEELARLGLAELGLHAEVSGEGDLRALFGAEYPEAGNP
jgi:uncharacterized protein GlcG (DUF336 family)